MQPAFKFEIKGLKEIMHTLDQLPTESMKKTAVRNALKKAALPIEDAARENARNIKMKSQEIADSIKTSTSVKRSQRKKADRSRVTVYVGSTHPLSHLFEFGTAQRFTERGAYRGFIPAMPFLRPAWDSNKKIALDRIGEELWKEIQKAARRLAKKAEKGTLTKKQIAGLR